MHRRRHHAMGAMRVAKRAGVPLASLSRVPHSPTHSPQLHTFVPSAPNPKDQFAIEACVHRAIATDPLPASRDPGFPGMAAPLAIGAVRSLPTPPPGPLVPVGLVVSKSRALSG